MTSWNEMARVPVLAKRVIQGDVRAAARLMSDIDNEKESVLSELKDLYGSTGKAHIIGVTGTPGAGKSTLVGALIKELRKRKFSIGVIAVDPTSPFTGGAILGDRIRMQQHALDADIFIRSLGTRGCLGGVSHSTLHIAKVMDAMGKDIIIIETVGVGQDEVDIVNMADTSIVTLVPGQGDSIQSIKAGILEIADIFVINKCEREGVNKLEQELKTMLEMAGCYEDFWRPPIVRTESLKHVGLAELTEHILDHRRALMKNNTKEKFERRKAEYEFLENLKADFMKKILRYLKEKGDYVRIIESLSKRHTNPYEAAETALKDWYYHASSQLR